MIWVIQDDLGEQVTELKSNNQINTVQNSIKSVVSHKMVIDIMKQVIFLVDNLVLSTELTM